jgi:alkanesulfonate monooxygenase
MLEEYIQVLLGTWSGEPFSFDGRHYRIADIAPRPMPVQRPRPHLIVGGHGRRRTPLLAARYADEYNIDWPSLEMCRDLFEQLRLACHEVGRDHGTVVRSALLGVMLGATETDAQGRRDAGLASLGVEPAEREAWLAAHRDDWLVGDVDHVVSRLREFADAGVQRVMLMHAPAEDLETLELIGRHVVPALADA